MSRVRIVEVGPRDGLQNETEQFTPATRVQLIEKLVAAGLKTIEAGAFVHPKWVPQMQGSDKVLKTLFNKQKKGTLAKNISFPVLVPNARGLEDALKVRPKEIAIFGASSEGFSQKNINCSIAESFRRFEQVTQIARSHRIEVRGYLSTVFGCPYDGRVSEKRVLKLIEKMLKLGVYEVSLGDTIGVATPRQVSRLLEEVVTHFGADGIAMHFHDTRGTALANVLESLEYGITVFDSSVASLGGCPYAKGASGNLATEDLVYMLEGMRIRTGVKVEELIKIRAWLEKKILRRLPSHVGQAGLPLPGTLN
jgi:hydroxymethylglutaryl-CoA lyase